MTDSQHAEAPRGRSTVGFKSKSTLDKVESTVTGIVLSLVMPLPGSMEVRRRSAAGTGFRRWSSG